MIDLTGSSPEGSRKFTPLRKPSSKALEVIDLTQLEDEETLSAKAQSSKNRRAGQSTKGKEPIEDSVSVGRKRKLDGINNGNEPTVAPSRRPLVARSALATIVGVLRGSEQKRQKQETPKAAEQTPKAPPPKSPVTQPIPLMARIAALEEAPEVERIEEVPSTSARKRAKRRKREETENAEPTIEDKPKTDTSRERVKETAPEKEIPQFVEDDQPSNVDPSLRPAVEPKIPEEPTLVVLSGLLLPQHVFIADDAGSSSLIDIRHAQEESKANDDSDIEWLDDLVDNKKGSGRYFAPPQAAYNACRLCGGSGHKENECKRVVCLTCGAKDEHQTRSCPIPLTCFRCGGRGHISANCLEQWQRKGCDRCGSDNHKQSNCPTLWRIYTYISSEEREDLLEKRSAAQGLPFLEVGELYVGNEIWCYSCGRDSHWGDDCSTRRVTQFNKDPTIFSKSAAFSGPFAEDRRDSQSKGGRRQRGWEKPMNPGKDGRERQARKQQLLAKNTGDSDDEEDWFASRSKDNTGSSRSLSSRIKPRGEPDDSKGSNRKQRRDRDRASTQDRDSRSIYPRPSSSKGQSSHGRDKKDESDRRRSDDSRHRSRRRDDDESSKKNGPRYQGGYSR